jgi:hypothetical protein
MFPDVQEAGAATVDGRAGRGGSLQARPLGAAGFADL